ncbi:MAG: hypothetical protein HY392_00910 [Candidatus Diapherotrites archaeon]|nr:hypothetical protein [Candidatus Diapherotrites archaeon]
MNKYLLALGLIAVILVAGCAQNPTGPAQTGDNTPNPGGNESNPEPQGSNPDTEEPSPQGEELEVGNFAVEITEAGYVPQELTIKKGSTVTWTNKTSTQNWPATAQHPTHEKYPGSSITKCGTAEAEDIFDACKGLAQGESFSFTFNEVGEWAYHEHLSVKMFGKIIVVE